MKKLILLSITLCSLSLFGQATKTNKYYLESEVEKPIYRHTNYLKSFENVGDEEIDGVLEKATEKLTTKTDENAVWFTQRFFNSTTNEAEAQAILSATYNMKTGVEIITEDRKAELPYIMTYEERFSTAEVVRTIQYTDGTPNFADTIHIKNTSKVLPGKKLKTLDELKESTISKVLMSFWLPSNPTEKSNVSIIFPKIKIKDKGLKEEYATVQSLLKAHQYAEAGVICKKIMDAQPKSLEAKAAVGLCYELVGNYPEAQKHIKPLKDFHMLSRARKNMKVLDYARSIGFEPVFAEF